MTTTHTNKVALLVHSCDRYEFLFKGFDYFFLKYWDQNIPCNYYFATEEKEVDVKGFINIKSGKGEWSKRLAYLINNCIPEEYIIYMQEDMWLSKPVNDKFFSELFTTAINNNWDHIKLHSLDCYKTEPTSHFIEGFNITKVKNKESNFLMCHEVTLWKKNALLEQLTKSENPWENEHYGTVRLQKTNRQILQADYFGGNGRDEINKNNNPVLRSEYWTISKTGTLHSNVERFIKEMKNDDAEDKQYIAELEDHYNNKLTHDGKPRPKQRNFYKKIKHRLKKEINNLSSKFSLSK